MEKYTIEQRNEAIAKMIGWIKREKGDPYAGYWFDEKNDKLYSFPFFNCNWNELMLAVEYIKYKYHWQIVSHQFIDDELTAQNDHVNVYTGEYWCMIHNEHQFASDKPLIDVCGCSSELQAVFMACSDFALLEDQMKISR